MNNDTIYRQAVLELIENYDFYCDPGCEDEIALCKGVKNLPSVQPEPKWIPCSKRLPEVTYDYLGNWNSTEVILLMNDEEYINVCNGHFNPCGLFEVYEPDGPVFIGKPVKDVLAWMPLPEPYQEGEQDE